MRILISIRQTGTCIWPITTASKNRYKCRFRRYRETDLSYLEQKLKSNKKRTIKDRVLWPDDVEAEELAVDKMIEPCLFNNYRRMSFWNRVTNERMTVDFDLNYRRPGQEKSVRLDRLFIVELKRFGKIYGSRFVRLAKEYGSTPKSISKFCLGRMPYRQR